MFGAVVDFGFSGVLVFSGREGTTFSFLKIFFVAASDVLFGFWFLNT